MQDGDSIMTPLKPKCLRDGDRVAVVAPSSPISSMVAIKQSLEVMKQYGLEPVLGRNITEMRSEGWSSAPLDDRVEELAWAFGDESIDGVIAAEGGYSAIELLPYLPYEMIRESQKTFMGMSDITAINNALLRCAGLNNFSGPNTRIRQDKKNDAQNLGDALALLKTDAPWGITPWKRLDTIPRSICGGIVTGPAMGGNMTLFTALLGTPFMPDVTGCVLFFEDVHANGYEVSMNLNQLDLGGVLDKCAGVVFGDFEKQPDRGDQDFTIEDVVVRMFRDRLPCVFGFNFSHGDTVGTIPLGCETVLDADNCVVSFGNPFGDE